MTQINLREGGGGGGGVGVHWGDRGRGSGGINE